MRHLLVSILALSSTSLLAAGGGNKIIYGDDDRLDLYQVTDSALVELASSTAAMIPKEKAAQFIDRTDPTVLDLISQPYTLKKTFNVCAGERFEKQVTIGDCSGFLVGEKTIVTAGHCVNESTCGNNNWVFDYAITSAEQTVPLIAASNVYSCKKVIRSVFPSPDRMDYAVIELDRPVAGRRPLQFRRTGAAPVGTKLVVIGYPSGLPVKIAGGAEVAETNSVYLTANLDTYGGNSGSAVFNAETHEVEGILVRGKKDYVDVGSFFSSCRVSNVVANSEAGESVTLITNVAEIQKTKEDIEAEATKEEILNLFAKY